MKLIHGGKPEPKPIRPWLIVTLNICITAVIATIFLSLFILVLSLFKPSPEEILSNTMEDVKIIHQDVQQVVPEYLRFDLNKRVINNITFKVNTSPFEFKVLATCHIYKQVITINSIGYMMQSREQNRMTLMHELGHCLAHFARHTKEEERPDGCAVSFMQPDDSGLGSDCIDKHNKSYVREFAEMVHKWDIVNEKYYGY